MLSFDKKTIKYYLNEDLSNQKGEYQFENNAILIAGHTSIGDIVFYTIRIDGNSRGISPTSLFISTDKLELMNLWFSALRYITRVNDVVT
jgi:hypothetical protein